MFARFVHFGAAMMLLLYGFGKINGSQFTVLDSELDRPMGEVSGFWLTWYFFGYSKIYGTIIALVEIIGAMLLTARRTTLLGACLLVPVLANIVLVDIFYSIDLGATLVAIILLGIMLSIIAPKAQELRNVLLPRDPGSHIAWKWGVRAAMLGTAFAFTYWVANYNNRNPTPIDGVWDVVHVEPPSAVDRSPVRIFFEYNRAGWVSFKFKDGTYQTHDFEVEAGARRLRMWERWISKGPQIFDGTYTLSSPSLQLIGSLAGVGLVSLDLHRRPANSRSSP